MARGRDRPLAVIPGMVPPLDRVFTGCRFADRCDRAWALCRQRVPPMIDSGEGQTRALPLYTDRRALDASGTERREVGDSRYRMSTGRRRLDLCAAAAGRQTCKVHFPIRKGLFKHVVGSVKAVDGVTLEIPSHRTLALVGESGCGKTTVGKGILQLLPTTAGYVTFEGTTWARCRPGSCGLARATSRSSSRTRTSSLNPRMRVMDIVEEGMAALGRRWPTARERQARVDALLGQVGLVAGHEVALSARVLRRAAPAHRDRARAGGRAQADHLR